MSVRVGIVGVSGYTGVELHRLLSAHSAVELCMLAAGRSAGRLLDDVWPGLDAARAQRVEAADAEALAERCDAVLLALPHGHSPPLVQALLDAGRTVIDLGADFRLRDPAVWQAAYGAPHPAPALLAEAVYGLPEAHREDLRGAKLVANPGCYPTATALAALPLVREGLADFLVADCVSGVSGAGRKPGARTLYAEVHESVGAYGVGGAHRHVPEIEQTLGVPVAFTPHLVPMSRGMLATVTARVPLGHDILAAGALEELFRHHMAGHPAWQWAAAPPSTREVRGTGLCRVHAVPDADRGVVSVFSAIDNLGKGAAAQAVQNLNLALGFDELMGVPLHPFLP